MGNAETTGKEPGILIGLQKLAQQCVSYRVFIGETL